MIPDRAPFRPDGRRTMKHLRRVTVVKAHDDEAVLGILDRVFGFVIEIVSMKGKNASHLD